MSTTAQSSYTLKKIRIGDRLVEANLISDDQLNKALEQQKHTGRHLGQTLIELNIISEDDLMLFLSQQLNIDYIDLKKFTLDPQIVKQIPEIHARRLRALALEFRNDMLLVGMADPTDIVAHDELQRILKSPFQIALIKESIILKAIDKLYRQTEKIKGLAQEVDDQLGMHTDSLSQADLNIENPDAPLIQLLNVMITDAVSINASDIHVEPEENATRIRFRTDGILHDQEPTSQRLAGAIISRLKLMANLDISERRLPQDGRFRFVAKGQQIDIRLSTMPMQYGETAVMRLLNQTTGIPAIDAIGLDPDTLKRLRHTIHSPHGLILVTGPTGSGKTTTLYSALKDINDPGKKIITIEDPIEYQIPGITQVQVNPKINLDFARILRSLLRQDPDVALIGEMRDTETMEMALRTAMTGHLVLSTLHTNDAISSVARLMEMGATPFLVATSLKGVLAQRLIRKLCGNCATTTQPTAAQLALIATTFGGENIDTSRFKQHSGCKHCNDTGYMGRTVISEFIEITNTLQEPIQSGNLQQFAQLASAQPGYQNLAQAALKLALDGVTSFDEVARICFGSA